MKICENPRGNVTSHDRLYIIAGQQGNLKKCHVEIKFKTFDQLNSLTRPHNYQNATGFNQELARNGNWFFNWT